MVPLMQEVADNIPPVLVVILFWPPSYKTAPTCNLYTPKH